MAFPVPSAQLARWRHGSRRLARQAATNEHHTQSLLITAENNLRHAEDAFTDAIIALGTVSPACNALRIQVSRHRTGVAGLRQLCLHAQQHQLAADLLVNDLAVSADTTPAVPPRHAILVVDDHADSRDALAQVLKGAGFVVRTAANGLEAVLIAYEIQPSVIIMDVMMPVLDGVEATRLIKAIDELRDASVIAYSATPPESGLEDQALFSAVLRKPSSPDVLIATVQQYAGNPS